MGWQACDTSGHQDDDVYVSWNGATEVVAWELQGEKSLGNEDESFETVDYVQKEGFERISSFQRTRTITPIFALRH